MFRAHSRTAVGLLFVLAAGCAAPGTAEPSQGEVPLAAGAGWEARLVLDVGATGVWTVGALQVFPQYAVPEVVGLDDLGRCWVCVSYSGKWTPLETVHDGRWLGGLALGDVDPRVAGAELYTGGQSGNLYQVLSYPHGALDQRLIAHLPGREIHTVVAGDVDPTREGAELFVFTRPGGLYRIDPTGPHGTFEVHDLGDLPGRVRDALLLPGAPGHAPRLATVSRAGRLGLLSVAGTELTHETVHEEPMGMGRLALAPGSDAESPVLYSTLDDGRILRHARGADDAWVTETIHVGRQGPRGLAAGRFHADPEVEAVAIFGYSGEVELLTRGEAGWSSERIFSDRDKGHWLAAAEVDGRNATRELLASGYGGRIVLLARPPGTGLPEPPERP